ncbi:Dam family site-specific DNA-(adenine-N6)-methyltransferase [Slackia piriformis]|nr:Dam family site-specific DNA-(adenine-N6)-methyltransferase [Slackia piriformis]
MGFNAIVERPVHPFVKWAGGKRQLLGEIRARMPRSYDNYYEPFVGGGAVFFDLGPSKATINDINTSLINAYCQIRDNPYGVMRRLDVLDDGQNDSEDPKAYYYDVRKRYNAAISSDIYDAETAALFIYINKHCFNGLYRVNAKGLFNVPYNNSTQVSYAADNILGLSNILADTTITNEDFETACIGAKAGDFVFFDSPYAPLNPTSFESYTKEGFSQEEHMRLARLYRTLSSKGCYCMLTNHNTPFIRELYDGFTIDVVSVRRAINSDASKRTGTEVIITNY